MYRIFCSKINKIFNYLYVFYISTQFIGCVPFTRNFTILEIFHTDLIGIYECH